MADYPISKEAVQKTLLDLKQFLSHDPRAAGAITMVLYSLEGFRQMEGVIDINRYEAELREKHGDDWLYRLHSHMPAECLEIACDKAILVWAKKVSAKQSGETLAGSWVDNGEGCQVCSVCGVLKRLSEIDGECANCGAKIDAKGTNVPTMDGGAEP